MGYRHPAAKNQAAIEVYPITGKKLAAAAAEAGLSASSIPTLLVEGDNKPGLGHAIALAMAQAEINIAFFMAHAIGRKYAAVIGLESDDDAKKAASLIKKATARAR
jgi:hypothetical protein